MGDMGAPGTATVRVWVAPVLPFTPRLESLVANLTPAERARTARYRHPRDARRFSAARGWLRLVLAEESGMRPADIRLTEGPGKPAVVGGKGPFFNLSRAADLAVIAVAGREVGVDVEHAGTGRRALDAVDVACSPSEAADLDRLPPGEQAEAFLRLWTAKEAYLKARGVGLSVPPDRVQIGRMRRGAPAPVGVTGEPGLAPWRVSELRPARGYVGAVAAEGPDWTIQLWDIASLGGRCGLHLRGQSIY